MRNYKRALSAINKYYNKRAADISRADSRFDSRGLRVAMTPAGLTADLRKNEKKRAAALAWVDACAAAAPLEHIQINVNWIKSRMWGYCPRAEVWVRGKDAPTYYATGTASGCGYDKESAAIDSALSDSATLGRFFIENWARVCKCYGVSMGRGVPELNISGKGINTLRGIFEAVRCWAWASMSGRAFDGYEVRRG